MISEPGIPNRQSESRHNRRPPMIPSLGDRCTGGAGAGVVDECRKVKGSLLRRELLDHVGVGPTPRESSRIHVSWSPFITQRITNRSPLSRWKVTVSTHRRHHSRWRFAMSPSQIASCLPRTLAPRWIRLRTPAADAGIGSPTCGPAKCGGEGTEYSQGEHCCRDVIRGRLGYCRGGAVEYEQPRPGDLARESFAVADGEEGVAASVHHQGWYR